MLAERIALRPQPCIDARRAPGHIEASGQHALCACAPFIYAGAHRRPYPRSRCARIACGAVDCAFIGPHHIGDAHVMLRTYIEELFRGCLNGYGQPSVCIVGSVSPASTRWASAGRLRRTIVHRDHRIGDESRSDEPTAHRIPDLLVDGAALRIEGLAAHAVGVRVQGGARHR